MTFLYVLVPPSPAYGWTGLPQAFFVLFWKNDAPFWEMTVFVENWQYLSIYCVYLVLGTRYKVLGTYVHTVHTYILYSTYSKYCTVRTVHTVQYILYILYSTYCTCCTVHTVHTVLYILYILYILNMQQ